MKFHRVHCDTELYPLAKLHQLPADRYHCTHASSVTVTLAYLFFLPLALSTRRLINFDAWITMKAHSTPAAVRNLASEDYIEPTNILGSWCPGSQPLNQFSRMNINLLYALPIIELGSVSFVSTSKAIGSMAVHASLKSVICLLILSSIFQAVF